MEDLCNRAFYICDDCATTCDACDNDLPVWQRGQPERLAGGVSPPESTFLRPAVKKAHRDIDETLIHFDNLTLLAEAGLAKL